jgi:large subunit ribosomal protein L10
MKSREIKEKDLDVLRTEFAATSSAFLVEYKGLTVVAIDELRRKVRDAGGTYRVVKNTLARKASEGTGVAPLVEGFRGPTAIVGAGSEVAKVAKTLTEFAKTNPALVLKAGVVEGTAFDAAQVKTLADIPSREELLSRLLFLLKSPMQRVVTVIAAPVRNLAVVINQVAETKSA